MSLHRLSIADLEDELRYLRVQFERQEQAIRAELAARREKKVMRKTIRTHIHALREWKDQAPGRNLVFRKLGPRSFELDLVTVDTYVAARRTTTLTFTGEGTSSRKARQHARALAYRHLETREALGTGLTRLPRPRLPSPAQLPALPPVSPTVPSELVVTRRTGFPDQLLTKEGFVVRPLGDGKLCCIGKLFGGERIVPLTPVELRASEALGLIYQFPEEDPHI